MFIDVNAVGRLQGKTTSRMIESKEKILVYQRYTRIFFFLLGFLPAPPLERKTDFRPKHIPHSQSAHYKKYFPQRSLPRCGHHALVCIPMLLTKIQIIFTQFKNAIPVVFCIRNPVYFHPCLSTKSIHLRIGPCRNRRRYWDWRKSCRNPSSKHPCRRLHIR